MYLAVILIYTGKLIKYMKHTEWFRIYHWNSFYKIMHENCLEIRNFGCIIA